MESEELKLLAGELNYLLGKIQKHLKANEYVYPRVFESWQNGYNQLAERLNSGKILSVPVFRITSHDYTPSGKSIQLTTVDKLSKTIRHQLTRLEEKLAAQQPTASSQPMPHPLLPLLPRDAAGQPLLEAVHDRRILFALPAGEVARQRFTSSIQPLLERLRLEWVLVAAPLTDDQSLSRLCAGLLGCRLTVIDLAGRDPQTLFILGLAYASGKPVILLQPQSDPAPFPNLGSSALLHYADNDQLAQALGSHLQRLLDA